jgi:hypothetical protein
MAWEKLSPSLSVSQFRQLRFDNFIQQLMALGKTNRASAFCAASNLLIRHSYRNRPVSRTNRELAGHSLFWRFADAGRPTYATAPQPPAA